MSYPLQIKLSQGCSCNTLFVPCNQTQPPSLPSQFLASDVQNKDGTQNYGEGGGLQPKKIKDYSKFQIWDWFYFRVFYRFFHFG